MFSEKYLLKCNEETMWELYNNQYNEELNIPDIDMIQEEEYFIFKIYIDKSKYICRCFDNYKKN
tara:strand:+ start:5326 stop:5517 length:192 start_codon:yes stop_codon:yes gene_type:complete